MSKKKLTPAQKVKAIEEARQFMWDFQRKHSEYDIEKPILEMDRILREAQKKAAPNRLEESDDDGENKYYEKTYKGA